MLGIKKISNLGLILIVFCILFSACGPSLEEQAATSAVLTTAAATNTPLPSATPVPTSTPRPTSTPIPVTKTPTPVLLYYPDSTLECISWSIVDHTYLGDEICIYGSINKVKQEWSGNWYFIVEFSSSEEDFKVLDVNNYYWPDIKKGDCILLKGVIRDFVTYIYLSPFIDGIPTDIYSIDEDYCNK